MRKHAFLLALLLGCIGLQAQEYYINLHQSGQILFQNNVNEINNLYFQGNDPASLYINSNGGLNSFPVTAFDSITFAWQEPPQPGDTVFIHYDGTTATVINPYPSWEVSITTNGAKVTVTAMTTSLITYCLSGTASPSRFEIESTTTPIILLNDVHLNNPTGKAMDLTCSAGIILKLADGTENTLSNAGSDDAKSALTSENNLLIQGNGTLTANSTSQHAIKVKGLLTMNSGTIHTQSLKDGIHTENLLMQGGNIDVILCDDDGISCEYDGTINGGSITITTPSDGTNAISVDSTLVINDGEININLTGGEAKCIKADKELIINGGTFVLDHSGDVSKGLKSDGDITITGGTFIIHSSGSTVLDNGDPAYCTAIKSDANINISGGDITIDLPTSNHGGKGISCAGNMTISGNNTINIETHGDGSSYSSGSSTDTYSSSCLRAEGNMQILSGTITLSSTGKGGKGIKVGQKTGNTYTGTYTQGSSDGTGPTLTISTTGTQIVSGGGGGWPPGGGSASGSAKAIKVGGVATVYGGTTTVTTTQKGAEGLESKTQINIEGGQHYFKCYDDCLSSSGKIFFNGGVTVCFSNGNDAVDSNAGQAGAITIGNGVAFAYTTKGNPEEGFDCDNNSHIRITGTGIGISAGGSQGGGGGWPPGGGGGNNITGAVQGYYFHTNSYSFQTGRYFTLSNTGGTGGSNLVTFSFEANCTSNLALITATGMEHGSTYYVKYGNQAPTNPTTSFHGLYLGGTSSASTQAFSFTAQ